jgi:threonine synthase
MWRYFPFLPIRKKNIISLKEGGTPILTAPRLAEKLNIKHIWFKNETSNPTGSFKDRGSSALVSKAKEIKAKCVIIDSSGNAAASLAAYAAKAGLKCYVFTPSYASGSKLIQAAAYGAKVVKVQGTRKDVYDMARLAHKKFGWFYCGFQSNPYAIQGLKTIAYEICEQFNWMPPDLVIFPVGTGSSLLGSWKGFTELKNIGIIKKVPSLVCVQPEGCAPISNAFQKGLEELVPINKPETIAEGLMIGYPIRGKQVLKAVKATCGVCEIVSDDEIIDAVKLIGKLEGLFVEPSAAASLAGLSKLIRNGVIGEDKKIVCMLTGTGLKTADSYSELLDDTLQIKNEPEELDKIMKN